MCYRFYLKASDLKTAAKKLQAARGPEFKTRFNIAPGSKIPAIRKGAEANEALELRWGLVPAWSKTLEPQAAKLANARGETLAEKPSFRESFKQRRCVVAASGFFEWEEKGGRKMPWLFSRRDGEPLLFAGLWESWRSGEGELLESCAIVTTSPNALLARIHDRMPVILEEEGARSWLESGPERSAALQELLRPLPADTLQGLAVDPWVNSVRHDDERCIAPYTETAPPGEQLGLFGE
jgi:putative SOS response-associated peptidase YedK